MDLKTYQIKKRLTISELAAHVGISQPYMSEILLGYKVPSVSIAKQIQERTGGKVKAADVLGI
jgi:transcriptional regulator with XRE-family HTH domain